MKHNIRVSLEEAKSWYESGNSTLKNLALHAFKEEELRSPASWNDIDESSAPKDSTWIDDNGYIRDNGGQDINPNCFSNETMAKKALAIAKYSMLAPYYGGIVKHADWVNVFTCKYAPSVSNRDEIKVAHTSIYSPIAFHSREQFEAFKENNLDILKDYLGI